MALRIIGGIYSHRLITIPKGVEIRPTQDKVRGAVFNILGDIQGSNVLELFAGSGALGIEAISRGARHVTFVDNNQRCVETIRRNCESLDIGPDLYTILNEDAILFVNNSHAGKNKFNIIFLDPPYYRDLAKKCLINIDACDILRQNGRVVVEYFKKDGIAEGLKAIALQKTKKYGDTLLGIYRAKPPESSSVTG